VSVDAEFRVSLGGFTLDAALHVADNELCVLVGPNGAGKTTVLRALAGLLAIDEGTIRLDDTVVDAPADDEFVPPERRSVGVVFQEFLLFPNLNARDNVAFGLRERGMRKAVARDRADAWLERVGLGDKRSARPRELSSGQAQRVALARALAPEPSLLLMDEPLAALDVQTRAELRRDLRTALDGTPGARILVTHDPIDALTLADRVLILEDGVIVQTGSPADVVSQPRSQYVADLVGVNLFRGEAVGHVVRLMAGEQLTVADEHSGDVVALIAPRAVSVHRNKPSGSARNVWAGTVAGIERIGDRVRLRIAGPVPIVAEITPESVTALELRDGDPVWAAVKATEIDVSPT
jgi:molybdate transport system ATP-binding protein